MALGPDWISQSWFLVWIFTLLLSESQTKKTSVYYMKNPECAEFKYLGGATVYSHDKQYTEYYEHMISCRMTFKAENEDWKLVLRFISLDIPDRTDRICNDAVYVFDSDQILRPFDEAGGNFGLCGNEVPTEPMQSSGPFITVHFRTDAKGPRGTGFKFIVTAFSEDYQKFNSCASRFTCNNKWCIDEDLVCDDIDHCTDSSDELDTGPSNCGEKESHFLEKFFSLGITASVTITVGSLIVIIVFTVVIACCCRRTFCKPHQETSGTTSTATSIVANGTPIPNQGHQYPIQHPYPQQYQHTHQGYFPMQPVYPTNNHTSMYTPYMREGGGYINAPSVYSSNSQTHSQPTSYHRSYTPTSSRSGKSNKSNNSTSVTYSQGTDKVTLPVNL
ncbi:uncharacterized protein [Mytilus edulis]